MGAVAEVNRSVAREMINRKLPAASDEQLAEMIQILFPENYAYTKVQVSGYPYTDDSV